MSITEHERHRLFTWFEEHMGKDLAATMMNLVPPVGWGDVATSRDLDQHAVLLRRDLDHHAVVMRGQFDEHQVVTQRALHEHRAATQRALHEHWAATQRALDEHRAVTQRALGELKSDMATQFESTRQELRLEMRAMEARIGRTFAGWLFLSQAAVVGVVTALVSVF